MKPVCFVGIDLAWSETNPSALAILSDDVPSPKLLSFHLVTTLETMIRVIRPYLEDFDVRIGIDAPLKVPNTTGNRETERAFLRDFARYKIGMLPVNRSLMERMFGSVRGEVLLGLLEEEGFQLSDTGPNGVTEVYPHATIAVCFNNNRLLPYKRKKGRSVTDVKAALGIYRGYLRDVVADHPVFETDISALKGKELKAYEDTLDGITSAYTLWYCFRYPERCKVYRAEGEGIFVTPFH